jgi:hypothetical protein
MLKLKKWDDAKEFYDKSIKILKMILNSSHRFIAVIYKRLGKLYHKMNSNELSTYYYKQSFDITKELFGETHLDIAICYYKLAKIEYENTKNYDQIKNFINYSLQILNKNRSQNLEYLLKVYQFAGKFYKDYDKKMNALNSLKEANEISILLKDNKKKVELYSDISKIYEQFKYRKKALEFMQNALQNDKNNEKIKLEVTRIKEQIANIKKEKKNQERDRSRDTENENESVSKIIRNNNFFNSGKKE